MRKDGKREPVFHKSTSFEEAEAWEIEQVIRMTSEERQSIAKELRARVYGDRPPDIRESHLQKE